MTDRFQVLLDEIDGWLARVDSGGIAAVPRDELMQWQITLTVLHDEWYRLKLVSQAAVDAFLLRPPKSEPEEKVRTSAGRSTGKKLYQRLAESMAELEKVLVQLKVEGD